MNKNRIHDNYPRTAMFPVILFIFFAIGGIYSMSTGRFWGYRIPMSITLTPSKNLLTCGLLSYII